MDPFEAGRREIISSASSDQDPGEASGAAQWDAVVTGFASPPGHSPHAAAEGAEALENWVAARDVGPLEDRDEAARRMNALTEDAILDLGSLSLRSLPRIPNEIRVLDVPFNRLTSLPDQLPASLERINVNGNQLSNLPALPSGLRSLDVDFNRLESLPAVLPAALQFLSADHNRLLNLPEALPSSLHYLYARHNRLTNLPELLPATLVSLDVRENQLSELPEALPSSLELLDASLNQLTSLPEDLLTRLGTGATIVLIENPLSEHVLTELNTVLTAEGYVGPRVHFSGGDESEASETDDEQMDALSETVAAWLKSNPQEGDREVLAAWQNFSEEPGAQQYGLFLSKLFNSVNSSNDVFRQSVANDLRQAANDPKLREQYFQLAEDANRSCEDRTTLTWNGMQTARLIAGVQNGLYDNKARLADLVDLGRTMFRMDALEAIAREKAQSLRSANHVEDVDDIEVFLAYQNKLRERLGLQHVAPAMRFFEVSGVTDADVDHAGTAVMNREAVNFADYLAMDWQPWDDVLRRIAPEDHAEAQDQLIDAMETEFDSRLAKRLEDQGLSGAEAGLVDDAKRELGPAILREIASEIKGALRDKVLNELGLTL